jgi:isoleucyl-tRNA synthetase
MADSRPYPDVPAQPSFPEIEERVHERWRKERSFPRSVEQRPAGDNEFVFYDGPPFANGLPHFGHLLTSYVKDVVPRYQTLRGRRVERRFGWDCHGLPAELEAEKQLGISGRKAIQEYGIERFNEYCRTSVLRYTEQWQEVVTRAGRWVDFQNDYKTMDLSYMESVLWAVKRLHEKGWLYEGTRVLAYSWAAQTPVSNFETRLDDSYRERQDPAITVRFALEPAGDAAPTELWAWTTTPWTLPSNLALAVGPELEYAVYAQGDRRVILGAECAAKYEKELEGAEPVGRIRGRELVGRRYQPLLPFFAGTENAFQVLSGDFVDVAEGSGVVHMAPGFGEDDLELCRAAGMPVLVPVDDEGRFTAEVPDWAGENVFEANPKIIRALKEAGKLVRHETIVHNYPHCWRTDTPLIYRAMNSWYVEVSAVRDRMAELNREIHWNPGHIRDGLFGNWLENARDWSISRNRFWGTPIPVWKSDDPTYPRMDVYGSVAELERDFGVPVTDLHRPAIDQLVRPNPDDPSGKAMMRRIPDVLDVWFDSGSMPFAQLHYPFENKERFEAHFPGGLHRRVRGPDARLVLHADGPRHRAVRQAALPQLHLSRRDRRRRRPEAQQTPAQLPRAGGGVPHARLGRDALVPDLGTRAARRRAARREGREGDRRRGACRAAADLERLVLLLAVCQHRRRHGGADEGRCDRARPLRPCEDPRAGPACRGAHGRLRHRRRLPGGARLPRGAQQLVHPQEPPALLEGRARRRQAGGVRHALDGAHDAVPGGEPAGAVSHRRDLPWAHRR